MAISSIRAAHRPNCKYLSFLYPTIKKEAVRTARELSHKSTAECFEIEDDIISRVMQNVYVKTCDVYARISSDRLEIYADVTGNRGRIRVNERGTFVNKNLIITKIVDRISKSM